MSESTAPRYQDPIFNLKLSELNTMIVKDKKLLKITGNVDLTNTHPLLVYSDKKEILVYSLEHFDSLYANEENTFLLAHGFEFEHLTKVASFSSENENGAHRFECLVDVSCLHEFHLTDIHTSHDLVQFIGYKDSSSSVECCRFKALFFRLIKRTSLNKYYYALSFQNSFMKSKFQ